MASPQSSESLPQGQIVRLHIAGRLTVPPAYPERGDILVEQRVYRRGDAKDAYWIVRVDYRVSRIQTVTYLVRLEDVAAIVWADEKGSVDPDDGDWWLSREIEKFKNKKGGEPESGPGIVYLSEHVPVIVRTESATTAGESSEYGMRPCCPDR